jgi:hypothetical protein
MKSEVLNIEELNIEDLKKKTDTPTFDLPPRYDTAEMRQAFREWGAKLKKQNRSLDQIQIDAHCANFHDPAELLAALRHSCGLTKAVNLYRPPPGKEPPKDSFQSGIDLIAKYKAEEAANAEK